MHLNFFWEQPEKTGKKNRQLQQDKAVFLSMCSVIKGARQRINVITMLDKSDNFFS